METVLVIWRGKFNNAPVLINKDDFDPAKHTLVNEAAPPPAEVVHEERPLAMSKRGLRKLG